MKSVNKEAMDALKRMNKHGYGIANCKSDEIMRLIDDYYRATEQWLRGYTSATAVAEPKERLYCALFELQQLNAKQPASAQPVAVPDRIVEAVILSITEAWSLGQSMYQYASECSGKSMNNAVEVQEEFDRVKSRVRAMLSAAQKGDA